MKISDIASFLNIDYLGKGDYEIYSISSINSPKKKSITYIENSKSLSTDILKKAGAILLSSECKNEVKKLDGNFILSNNPKLELAKLTSIFKKKSSVPSALTKPNIKNITYGENVTFGKNIKIGKNCTINNNVVIEDNVSIGDNVFLGHNVVVHEGTVIGSNVFIDSSSVIGSEGFGNIFNETKKWVHIYHVGNVSIGNNVMIGAGCCIDRATFDSTIISNGVIIDNMVHIAHNVKIGEDTAIAAKVGIAGSCQIGKRNMIGGMVGIIDHINTADDVTISATTTVNKNLLDPGIYTGIMPISKHSSWKRIAYWITKLDKIANQFKFKIK